MISVIAFAFSTAASVHAAPVIATITLHNGPVGVAYDPSMREVFVANSVSGDLQVFSDSTNQQVADVTALTQYAGAPYNLAYDSGKGEIWMTTLSGAYAISDANDQDVANVTSLSYSGGSLAIAYDSGQGELFLTFAPSGVQVVSDSSKAVVANVTALYVYGLVYDSAKSEIFASETNETSGASDIAVISDKTNSIVATIPVTSFVLGSLVYDPGKGEIFALGASTIYVISDTSNKIVTTIPISNLVIESYMAYDSGKGEIYINEGPEVLVLSDSTNALVATVNDNGSATASTGGLGGVAYDPGTGTIYAVNNGGKYSLPGSMVVISDASTGTSTSTTTSTTTTTSTATTSTATTSPTTSTTTTSMPTSSTTPVMTTTSSSKSGGVPEFPYQLLAAVAFTALLGASYLLVRTKTAQGGRKGARGTA